MLPGWQTRPRAEGDEARWHQRLAARTAYRAAGHDWPRHKAAITGVEHDLGVWPHSQRSKFHHGELDESKIQALDRVLPGWQSGRQRGRKPRQSPDGG
ncbi:helicase associated domain-containing protein [Arthrobacter globiformis]|uniref:helicase associated domain-containing protein n=1 Tax=Arthrobacter globiformis TaxID=1665 RepID=UPI0027D8C6C1|nr:helicase associated domain-containing protein [Arthrobacter globiformis]